MQKVASYSQLPTDRGFCVQVEGRKILLARDGDQVRAFSATCPHAGAPLDEGVIYNGHIVCPWHKGSFSLADGSLVEPPPLEGLDRYPVLLQGDDILIDPKPERSPQRTLSEDVRTIAIVGAGAAGAAATAALREFGFAGRVLLIGREPGLPFDRTSLSKFVVAGEMRPEETPLLKPESFYNDEKIERIQAEVSRLDVLRREIALGDGRTLSFDQALIATGAEPAPLNIEGESLRGVHVLRTREDAAEVLAAVRPGANAVILGSSFIGLEVASCLRKQNVNVAVVSPEQVPFARQFGDRIARSFRRMHEANGVVFHVPAKAAKIEGVSQVSGVLLEDGRRIPADFVVAGVGVRPATAFVSGVKQANDGGLEVDAAMRLAEGIYVAGDVAAFPNPWDATISRIEHWRVAQIQARVAVKNMLGGHAIYDAPPFFWTYHYGKNFEYLGHAQSWDEEVVIGDVEAADFVTFLIKSNRVAAVIACQRQRLTAKLAEAMRRPIGQGEALRMAQDMS